ncbi:hypothetical protein D3C76_692610 [compost metagenome]
MSSANNVVTHQRTSCLGPGKINRGRGCRGTSAPINCASADVATAVTYQSAAAGSFSPENYHVNLTLNYWIGALCILGGIIYLIKISN